MADRLPQDSSVHSGAKDRCTHCRRLQPLNQPVDVAQLLRQPGTEHAATTLHRALSDPS
jgi:hypothetical protein